MTNENMIYKAAVMSGLFSPEEAQAYIAAGKRLPIHTYSEWRRIGYQVKPGEHAALVVPLWTPSKKEDDQDENIPDMIRSRAYLFTASQVVKASPVHQMTREEIRAYNAILAEQRKESAVHTA